MGITGSKVVQEDKEEVTAASVPTTPILTPKHKKCKEEITDPRSPSLHILRTPITSSSASPLTPTQNTCDTFNINSPVLITNMDDPRSPTLAFTRTPITAADDTDLLKRVHMKNLQNIKKVISDMPSQIPPKLLESSPIKHRPNESKRKSFVGLLETNLDYVETDLDAVILSKSSPNKLKHISPSKSELKAKFLKTAQNDETVQQTEASEAISQVIQPVITSTAVQNEDTIGEQEIKQVINESAQTVVENLLVDDDGLVIQPQLQASIETEFVESEIVQVATPKITEDAEDIPEIESESITTTVHEFEKKVNHLIYTEEEHITTTPPVNKNALQTRTASNRTPLGTRNGNNAKSAKASFKTKPKLRVSDKPRRADYAVSRIPVFSTKNKAECENTPPRKMLAEGRKGRRAQWDNDNTLVI